MHLLPGAIAFGVACAVAPGLAALGVPADAATTVAFGLVLTPLELGLLLRAARAATGRRGLRAIPAVLAYHRGLGRRTALVPVLFAVALGAAMVWQPVGDAIAGRLTGILPGWLLPGYDPAAHAGSTVLVITLLVTLVIDGMLNPVVEELYFRGYLLPRLPVGGRGAIALSSALFAVQHYWQPQNWPLILVLELILTALIVRLRSLRLGVVMHVLTNSTGSLLALLAVLR
jgi:hypothetical protein